MALQKTMSLVDNFGITVEIPNCYLKVKSVSGDKNQMICQVDYQKSQTSSSIHSEKYAFAPDTSDDSANFIRQAYEYLKTLDEFSNSQDV